MSAGDHLQVPRQHGLFKHHGIDLGDGTIAHYLEGREILRSSIEDFCANQCYTVIIYPNSSPKDLTIKRARSRIGEKRYNLLFNNCEHFARWCKTGKHKSLQVENVLNKTASTILSISELMPKSFLLSIDFLLTQNLTHQTSHQKTKKIMNHLKQLKNSLTDKLDYTLKEIEYIYNLSNVKNKAPKSNQTSNTLLLKGQEIADQLNTIERVEAQITSLLTKTNLES